MKAQKITKAKRLLARFDHELRELLLNDLIQFTFKAPLISNTQAMTQSTLSVA
jgi:hypothetical protein